ncbi:DUF2613 domain-containing protein [Mycobacterium botniense]|uniref:Uncharacterized protein n=1 Tax=Mycobacterium botniense TaxID=84962 RepID=A0A7I9XW11_9MYCO|nr:DUF2613 domain-containing protein [Mycobacterium botniense]GFG73973.1 hypothetical protein MBOT_13380 [Mycobacterium botniense]
MARLTTSAGRWWRATTDVAATVTNAAETNATTTNATTTKKPSLRRLVPYAASSVVVGAILGAVAMFGGTFVVQHHGRAPQPPRDPNPSISHLVQYGNRCYHGHCLPCASKQECLNKLPPQLRP